MVNVLSELLEGRINAEQALEAWPDIDDPTDDRLMRNAWHVLYDYYTDDDIRAREPEYDAARLDVLRSFRDELAARLPPPCSPEH
jgi:hypothetical protein